MKKLALLLFSLGVLTVSCESEYEERLEQGKFLKERLNIMERSNYLLLSDQFSDEMESIREEIRLLAKISGHEDLFLSQVYGD